jgi:hypothetical protein
LVVPSFGIDSGVDGVTGLPPSLPLRFEVIVRLSVFCMA